MWYSLHNLKEHTQILHEKDFEFIVMTVAKISPKPYIWKEKYKHKTQDWNNKSQLIMKIKRFNCDQCGKNFARGCNMKLLLQNVHEIDSWI